MRGLNLAFLLSGFWTLIIAIPTEGILAPKADLDRDIPPEYNEYIKNSTHQPDAILLAEVEQECGKESYIFRYCEHSHDYRTLEKAEEMVKIIDPREYITWFISRQTKDTTRWADTLAKSLYGEDYASHWVTSCLFLDNSNCEPSLRKSCRILWDERKDCEHVDFRVRGQVVLEMLHGMHTQLHLEVSARVKHALFGGWDLDKLVEKLGGAKDQEPDWLLKGLDIILGVFSVASGGGAAALGGAVRLAAKYGPKFAAELGIASSAFGGSRLILGSAFKEKNKDGSVKLADVKREVGNMLERLIEGLETVMPLALGQVQNNITAYQHITQQNSVVIGDHIADMIAKPRWLLDSDSDKIQDYMHTIKVDFKHKMADLVLRAGGWVLVVDESVDNHNDCRTPTPGTRWLKLIDGKYMCFALHPTERVFRSRAWPTGKRGAGLSWFDDGLQSDYWNSDLHTIYKGVVDCARAAYMNRTQKGQDPAVKDPSITCPYQLDLVGIGKPSPYCMKDEKGCCLFNNGEDYDCYNGPKEGYRT